MFYWCENLYDLDLSNFITQKVTDMSNMFYFCRKLSILNLSSFNTKNVSKVKGIFYGCKKSILESNISFFKQFDEDILTKFI